MVGMSRLEYALRTPPPAGPRLFEVCRYAGFLSRGYAMASASDRVTGAGCCAATRAGHSRSPTVISTGLMGVLAKICREVEAPTRGCRTGFRPATRAVRLLGT